MALLLIAAPVGPGQTARWLTLDNSASYWTALESESLLNNRAQQTQAIGHIAVVQVQIARRGMRVFVQMIDAIGIDRRGAPLNAVHFVTLAEQQLRKVSAILPSDAGNQCSFLIQQWRPR
jgi:hypothetical protein